MLSIAFALLMLAPLVILVVNVGREAAGWRRDAAGPAGRGRRPTAWPVRLRVASPVIDAGRSLSPLAVLRRRRAGRRVTAPFAFATPVAPAAQPVAAESVAAAPVAAAPVPIPAALELPVTASTYGFVPAPASAFAAGPALTPRRSAEVIDFPDRFPAREYAAAQ